LDTPAFATGVNIIPPPATVNPSKSFPCFPSGFVTHTVHGPTEAPVRETVQVKVVEEVKVTTGVIFGRWAWVKVTAASWSKPEPEIVIAVQVLFRAVEGETEVIVIRDAGYRIESPAISSRERFRFFISQAVLA